MGKTQEIHRLIEPLARRGGVKYMFILRKKKGESEDKLIARFRKKTIVEGVMQEYRDREHYKKPSEKRKEDKYRIAHSIELEKKRNY
jgi:ribosomal protein S21